MTRTRNGSFHGTTDIEGDVDQIMFGRVLKEINQDLNMVLDIATGSNSPSVPPVVQKMDHSGTALAGSLLGIPLINQTINVQIAMEDADVSTYGGDVYILGCPIFMPPGETVIAIEIDTHRVGPTPTAILYDTSGDIETQQEMDFSDDTWRGFLQVGASGGIYYLLIKVAIDSTAWGLVAWRVHMNRFGSGTFPPVDTQNGTTFPVPTAATSINFETIHDQMFTDNYAIAGWVVNTLNRNINALTEALTGAPVEGNTDLTNDDSGDVDPVVSRFIAHTQSGTEFAGEAPISFPLWAEAFGACRADGDFIVDSASPPTAGLTTWFAPYPVDVNTSDGRKVFAYVPDFPVSGGSVSTLKATFLCVSEAGGGKTPTNWSIEAKNSVSTSALQSLTQLGSTQLYVATMTLDDWQEDQVNTFTLRTHSSGAYTFSELGVLGWCLYWTT